MLHAGSHNPKHRRVSASFTLIEMLVVLGIIGLVAAMTIPMMIPFVRQRKMTLAAETVKTACLLARSKAIKERRRISVTLLEAERLVIINDYDQVKRMLPILELDTSADNSASSQPEMELLRTAFSTNRNDYYVTLTADPTDGIVTAHGADTLSDATKNWVVDVFQDRMVVLSDGPGAGQERRVVSNTSDTLTVSPAWDDSPVDNDTQYEIVGPDLPQQRRVVSTSGDLLTVDRAWDPGETWQYPMGGDEYIIGDNKSDKDRCPHYVGNYLDEEERERILKVMAIELPRTLPEGARFDLDGDEDGKDPQDAPKIEADAWTYVFLPTGGVWTLPAGADNSRDTWSQSTYLDSGTNRPSGPRIYAPEDRDVVRLIVYAMTGQAKTE